MMQTIVNGSCQQGMTTCSVFVCLCVFVLFESFPPGRHISPAKQIAVLVFTKHTGLAVSTKTCNKTEEASPLPPTAQKGIRDILV